MGRDVEETALRNAPALALALGLVEHHALRDQHRLLAQNLRVRVDEEEEEDDKGNEDDEDDEEENRHATGRHGRQSGKWCARKCLEGG